MMVKEKAISLHLNHADIMARGAELLRKIREENLTRHDCETEQQYLNRVDKCSGSKGCWKHQ